MNISADIRTTMNAAVPLPLSGDVDRLAATELPLIVDLDGTLIRSDLLVEQGFSLVATRPGEVPGMIMALAGGKASLKRLVAEKQPCKSECLPYNEAVIAEIKAARAEGRRVYLASASNERYVAAVAAHLGLFDGIFASDDSSNLNSHTKAATLVEHFGEGGFDYIGNSRDDIAVWAVARRAIAVDLPRNVAAKLSTIVPDYKSLAGERPGIRTWAKLLRVHQWAKNGLLFVPVMTAQRFDLASLLTATFAFLLFSIAASSVYLINDLADLEADRAHPEKRLRPLAAGKIPLIDALVVAPLMLIAAIGGSLLLPFEFTGVLLLYLVVTTAYTFVLKRKMIVDVVTLASLYTARVAAGAAAISVGMSEWLLGFSMFIFTCLALIKRYVELTTRLDADLPDPSNRNYRKSDLDIVATLAAAAGFNAVTVFALYISSETVSELYSRPILLWAICPVLMYWLSRAMMMAHRRFMHDDPILFAIKDRNSLVCFGLIGAIVLAAI